MPTNSVRCGVFCMSDVVPHRMARAPGSKVRDYRGAVSGRDFNGGLQPAVVELEEGTTGRGTCLGCHDTPCMTMATDDMALPDVLSEFPGDPSRDVCPTGAISWSATGEAAEVNADACIGCGLCVARCPYGAISLIPEGVAVVESGDPDDLTVAADRTPGSTGHVRTQRVGRIGPIGMPAVRQMPEAIEGLNSHAGNLFIRNLLIECGIMCRIRRSGDTNIRMDGVIATAEGRLGVLAVELGSGMLESPRQLLEDVAVLHGRYRIEVGIIDPVSVVTRLPNARSEYFQVMRDIERVLDLRCRTVTVGALLAVLWQFETIEGFTGDLFVTSPDYTDLLPAMRHHLSDSIPGWEPYSGAYRPSK